MTKQTKLIATFGYHKFMLEPTPENIAAVTLLMAAQPVDDGYVPGTGYHQCLIECERSSTVRLEVVNAPVFTAAEHAERKAQAEDAKELASLRARVANEDAALREAAE